MHLGGTVPSQENLRTYSSDPLSPSSMAVASPSSSSTSTMVVAETKPERPSENAPLLSSSLPQPDPNDPNHLPSSDPLPPSSASSSSTTTTISSSSSPFPMITPSPPAAMAAGVVPPAAPAPPVPSFPSFRPVPPMPVGAPQFSPIPNPAIQPPGVAPLMTPVSVSAVRYPVAPQPYAHMSNGYPGAPMPLPVPLPSSMPPGMHRYPPPYTAVVRPTFPPHPPGAVGSMPPLSRPPVPAIRGVPPVVGSVARPTIPIIPIAEKPQTTVYVGKISTTVENDFLLSLLRLCGPVKSWKRAQDPTTGAPKGFGFCEFESAEGVLRALRLLSRLNIDGQELVLNVNQATRDYLERYVEKKVERQKMLKEEASENADKEETAPGVDKTEPAKPVSTDESKEKDGSVEKPDEDAAKKFGIVTEEDQEGDRDASVKLTSMLEERAKNRPPPPPPSAQATTDVSAKTEVPSKSRDGDSDVDIMKSDAAEDKNDDETTSEHKPSTENERPETSSSDRGKKQDRRSKESDHEHDLRREKERELERYERERERERMRREREREHKLHQAERLYKDRVKEWEAREREREYQRSHEKEREKERERERRREIKEQEDESDDDDSRKRRRRGSTYEERRRKRQREKDEDLTDRLREEEEIADANKRAIEEQKKKDELKVLSSELSNGNEKEVNTMEDNGSEHRDRDWNHEGDPADANFGGDEGGSNAVSEARPNSNAPSRKLGFGLVGSGKRTAVASLFQAEDDDDAEKEKKMRTLVPIEYSMEEMQAVQSAAPGTSANLVAAAEFAKRISGSSSKEEKSELEKERSRRTNDRLSQREKDRADDETKERSRDKAHDKDKDREHGFDRKTPETKKLLDAKQLIDMIPKTKEELFSYDINWAIYDKHELHERMRPWISKKITEFLGEEETTLVDYIVTSTKDHVKASQMLELLQAILDDEAEMFVLKMWRMLIFEIKKVETGLSLKSRT
ncbi:RNA-binding motif protein 25 isoform X2 [Nymphaea colorata]|uniref:RNA-binding motif protein 25 isoform X2 n=1 Tax=Nymphaea colorata TaxID=210225 RepID=UPI00129D4BD5|nr:RNA-binding motif protein 25 isoform X2 [Nymphaea colorata]